MSNTTSLRSALRTPRSLIRQLVRELHAYVPGEQPKIKGLIKLNTNENPYPPSTKVFCAAITQNPKVKTKPHG
jgi:histidinol-phosphate/aromatic aminotransferase/cobyric acid decarboxylase-like protein